MRITFELGDTKVTVEQTDYLTLTDALQLMEQVLRGAGFYFDGCLTVEEEELGIENPFDEPQEN